jgi:hypothetical protein
MKNSKSIVFMLIVLCMVLAFTACTNGSFDVMKENRTWTLTGIEVAGNLSGPFYFADDDLSSSLTVTATYSDREPRTVTGFTPLWEPGLNQTSVTISYTEGKITKTAEVSGSFHVAKAEARPTEKPQPLSGFEGSFPGGKYYAFGDFPQTLSDLSDDEYTSDPIYRGYYLGNDGYFYEKCSENGYDYPNAVTTYSNGTEVKKADAESMRYFKVEPIKWRVLNPNGGDSKILLAESILTANIPVYASDENRGTADDPIYPNNYEHSNIRAYLNGISYQFGTGADDTWEKNGFLQIAFTESAQALILTTDVDNSEASTNPDSNSNQFNNGANPYACDNTPDKIFLLSEKEATTEGYGFATFDASDPSRRRAPTDYALANFAYEDPENDYNWNWWLRSPGYSQNYYLRHVGSNGATKSVNPVYVPYPSAVVPALTISARNLQ